MILAMIKKVFNEICELVLCSLLFVYEHLKCEAKFLQLAILAEDWLKRLLDVRAFRIILLMNLQDPEDFRIDFMTHLLGDVLLLFFHSLAHWLNHERLCF